MSFYARNKEQWPSPRPLPMMDDGPSTHASLLETKASRTPMGANGSDTSVGCRGRALEAIEEWGADSRPRYWAACAALPPLRHREGGCGLLGQVRGTRSDDY